MLTWQIKVQYSYMNQSGWITILLLVSVLLLVFFYYQQLRTENNVESLEISPVATSLGQEAVYTDIEGNPSGLSDYIGQKIVAFSWASWCPSCVDQLTLLSEVSESQEDVVVLAINRGEPASIALSFLEFYELDTKVQLIMDPDDHFYISIDGYAMPETVVFDTTGEINFHKRGQISRDELVPVLESLE